MLNLKTIIIKNGIILHRNNREGYGSFDLKHINDNFTNIIYLDKSDISFKIDKNKNDISSNLIAMNYNEDNIAYNLGEINYIKNYISKLHLKDVYNILFYDKKTQIDFKNIFFNKTYEIYFKKMICRNWV